MFPIGAIIKKLLSACTGLWWAYLFISLWYISRSKIARLLDRSCQSFFKCCHAIYIHPPALWESPGCSVSLPTFGIVSLSFSNPDEGVGTCHCAFDFAFLWWLMVLSTYLCAYSKFLYLCLQENGQSFIFNWISHLFNIDL